MVVFGPIITEFWAKPSNVSVSTCFNPLPPPLMASSMKTPQKMPKPVSIVLLLFLVNVSRISLSLSRSKIFFIFLSSYCLRNASTGLMRAAFTAGTMPANVPANTISANAWKATSSPVEGCLNI